LQQSEACVQTWPYCAQVVEPGAGGGAVPPLDDEGPPALLPELPMPLLPHVPFVVPPVKTHGEPAQQSAVVVHAPPAAMHLSPEHTKKPPEGAGTHGFPQQSAPDAHLVPAGGGPFALQS
jgi:hypothetical protein